ncbi:MAG: hypothetical protein ABI644_06000 [Arenimonas sp.]
MKHSKLGIASFIMSIVIGVLVVATVVTAGVMQVSTPGGMDEKATSTMLIGLAIIGLLGLDLVAIGLGFAGVFQKDCKKVFAILGLVFSSGIVLGTVALMIYGNSMA